MFDLLIIFKDNASSMITGCTEYYYNSTYESFIIHVDKNEIILPRENVRSVEVKPND